MDPRLNHSACLFGNSQELYLIAQLLGIAKVRLGQARDALTIYLLRTDGGVEADTGQYSQFVGGVPALNIVGGISLSIAQFLSLLQRLAESHAILGHPGENVVGGAIDDGIDG